MFKDSQQQDNRLLEPEPLNWKYTLHVPCGFQGKLRKSVCEAFQNVGASIIANSTVPYSQFSHGIIYLKFTSHDLGNLLDLCIRLFQQASANSASGAESGLRKPTRIVCLWLSVVYLRHLGFTSGLMLCFGRGVP